LCRVAAEMLPRRLSLYLGSSLYSTEHTKNTYRTWTFSFRISVISLKHYYYYTHIHTHLTALCPGLPGWAGTRKEKAIWILLKRETVSGTGIRWAICKSAPRSSQITTPVPHHSVFYRPGALPAAQPTVPKYWRHNTGNNLKTLLILHHTHLTSSFPGQPG